MVGRHNAPPEIIQLVDIWGAIPTMWRVRRVDRFSADAYNGAYLVPMWGVDDYGMDYVVNMLLIWDTASGASCPPYVYVRMCDVLRRGC